MADLNAVGVDSGGTGITGAQADVDTGQPAGDRARLATPSPWTPDAVASDIHEPGIGVHAVALFGQAMFSRLCNERCGLSSSSSAVGLAIPPTSSCPGSSWTRKSCWPQPHMKRALSERRLLLRTDRTGSIPAPYFLG